MILQSPFFILIPYKIMFKKTKHIAFNKELWISNRERRFTMINYILEHQLTIGFDKKEIIALLGFEFNDIHSNIWTYYIGHKYFFSRKRKLYIYFNNLGKVYKLLKK